MASRDSNMELDNLNIEQNATPRREFSEAVEEGPRDLLMVDAIPNGQVMYIANEPISPDSSIELNTELSSIIQDLQISTKAVLILNCGHVNCPITTIITRFQQSMRALFFTLSNLEDSAHKLSIDYPVFLKALVTELTLLHEDPAGFHEKIRSTIMLDPARRYGGTIYFILSFVLSLAKYMPRFRNAWSQFPDAAKLFPEAFKRASNAVDYIKYPRSWTKDPEIMSKAVFSQGLRIVKTKMKDMERNCVICERAFSFGGKKKETRSRWAMSTLCGHFFCKSCLDAWRLEGLGGMFTCPMCRSCLVCGAQDCPIHIAEKEPARPTPLPEMIDLVAKKLNCEIKPVTTEAGVMRLIELREDTREDRCIYAFECQQLRNESLSNGDRVYFERLRDSAFDDVAAMIMDFFHLEEKKEG